jgi:hypothetical protein
MRAEPDKLEAGAVRLAVDQDEVGPDAAIAVRLVLHQHRDGFEQLRIEALAVPSRFLADKGVFYINYVRMRYPN